MHQRHPTAFINIYFNYYREATSVKITYRDRIYPRYTADLMTEFLEHDEDRYVAGCKPLLHRLRSWLPADKQARCLDVACGPGLCLYALQSAGYRRLTGIDISPQQINAARQVCADVHVVDALEYLKAHPGEFDLITALDILEHFTKDELLDMVDALYQALRPGGRLVVQTPNAESPWGMRVRYGDLTHELAFDPSSLKHLLSLSGFAGYSVKECGPYVHGTLSLMRWCLWRFIHALLLLWNYAEIGSKGSGVYTRVFIAKAQKPQYEYSTSGEGR